MNQSNPIIDILEYAQEGKLIHTFATAAGVEKAPARIALERLTGDIARKIAGQVKDSDRYDDLMDILDEDERDEYIDEPGAILGRDAVEDGEDILKAAYGSLDAARKAAGAIAVPEGIDRSVFERMMTLAATLTLAGIARRNRIYHQGAAGQLEPEPQDRGFIGTMLAALVTGFLEGFRQATRRKRRRRRRGTLEKIFGEHRSQRTRKRTRKRRGKSPSLNDLLGDLLRN